MPRIPNNTERPDEEESPDGLKDTPSYDHDREVTRREIDWILNGSRNKVGKRDGYNRYFKRETVTEERRRKKNERRDGAESKEDELHAYQDELRAAITQHGIESVNLADFFCRAEYLRGEINEKTMEDNLDLLRALGHEFDSYEDEGEMLHDLVQVAQPRYFKDAGNVDRALRDNQSSCYSAAQLTLAIASHSEKLRRMPMKLQWYADSEHVRVIGQRNGKWYAIEQPSWKEIPPEGFAGTVLTGTHALVQGFMGDAISAEYIESEEAESQETTGCIDRGADPYRVSFIKEPTTSYGGRVPEHVVGRAHSYREGRARVVLEEVVRDVMSALKINKVTRRAFLLALMLHGLLILGFGRETIKRLIAAFIERLGRAPQEWYENEDEYKAYLQRYFDENGRFNLSDFHADYHPYDRFFLQVEYLHGHPDTGERKSPLGAFDKLGKFKLQEQNPFKKRMDQLNDLVSGEGEHAQSQSRLTELIESNKGNEHARIKYYLSFIPEVYAQEDLFIQFFTNHARVIFYDSWSDSWYALEKPKPKKLNLEDIRGTVLLHPRAYVQRYMQREMTQRFIPRTDGRVDEYIPRKTDRSFNFEFKQPPTKKFEAPSVSIMGESKEASPMRITYFDPEQVREIQEKDVHARSPSSSTTKVPEAILMKAATKGWLQVDTFTDRNISEIKGLLIRGVSLKNPLLSEAGFAQLCIEHPEIVYLSVAGLHGDDGDSLDRYLPHVRGSNIRYLDLNRVGVSTLEALRGHPLCGLKLTRNQKKLHGLSPLAGPELTHFYFDRTSGIDNLEGVDKDRYMSGQFKIYFLVNNKTIKSKPNDGSINTDTWTINWRRVDELERANRFVIISEGSNKRNAWKLLEDI